MGKSLPIIILILTIGAPPKSEAALGFREVGAEAASLGGCGVGWMHGAEGLWWNPAHVGWASQAAFSLSCARPFSMAALSTETLSFILPTPRIGWGLGIQSYGFSLYRETTATLAGGRKILPRLYAGLGVRGTQFSIRHFGTDRAFCVDAGLLAHIGKALHWGISLRNLNGAKIRRDPCSQSLSTGIFYRPTEHLAFCADARKTLRFPLQIGAGAQIRLLPCFVLRTGIGSAPTRFSIGAGFHLGAADISYSAGNHVILGFSHQASIHWKIEERKDKR
ncbi:MAG: hypothetical protein DRP97_08370 [Candidatus Latescibacterota bacterium]|nr:MAG: hypothetical protein DRP97_08370 [Candidatus Latescibacterota bacterium]